METELDKVKLIKWIQEEIYGCETRRETEREIAMRELLSKIQKGFFNKV